MSDRKPVVSRISGPESWTNQFPQKPSAAIAIICGLCIFFGAIPLLSIVLNVSFEVPSWSLILVNILGVLGMGSLGLMVLRVSTLEAFGVNSTRIAHSGRVEVRTRFFAEPLVLVAITMLTFGAAALIFWLWDPYSFLPWGPGRRQSQMPLIFAGAVVCFVGLLALCPWRRRLVFTPDALEYRRALKPILIPWDTIDSLTPADEGFIKTVKVKMRPPGQPPTLDRKRFPDGTAQGKLAIHSMSVDPGTIVYALTKLWKEPGSRRLLETPEGVDQLFTGPAWRERIHMKPGQRWSPLTESR